MKKNSLAEVLEATANGNFKYVSIQILSEIFDINDEAAAKIIIECCRIYCVQNPPAGKEEDVVELLLTCKQHINKLNQDMLLKYLQSIYFIAKYITKQGKLELLLEMKSLLTPNLLSGIEDSKVNTTYKTIYGIMHNAFVQALYSETETNQDEVLYNMCYVLLQMNLHLSPAKTSITNTVSCYFKHDNFIRLTVDMQYKCYLNVIQVLVRHKTEENSRDDLIALMEISHVIIGNLFKSKNLPMIRDFINTCMIKVLNEYNMDMCKELSSILHFASLLTIGLSSFDSKLDRDNVELCIKTLNHCHKKFGNAVELQKISLILYEIFFNIVEDWYVAKSSDLNIILEEEAVISLAILFKTIAKITSEIEVQCRFCSKCNLKTDTYTSIMTSILATRLLIIRFNLSSTISPTLLFLAKQLLESAFIRIKNMHQLNCCGWKLVWRHVAPVTYNTGVKLYTNKNEECSSFFLFLIKYVPQLDPHGRTSAFNFDVVQKCLQCVATIKRQVHKFEESLLFSAIIVLRSTDAANRYNYWVTTKSDMRKFTDEDFDLQKQTVVCILMKHWKEINNLFNNLNYDNALKEQLLIDELTYYKKFYPSKVPMFFAFKKLCEFADTFTLAKILIKIWSEEIQFVHGDLANLLDEIIFNMEKDLNSKEDFHLTKKQFCLGILYIMQYYTKCKIMKQAVSDEINRLTIAQKPSEIAYEPVNANDECDIVSSYSSLTLNKYLLVMEYMYKGFNLLSTMPLDDILSFLQTELQDYNLFNFISNTAAEFKLHIDRIRYIQCWFLNLKVSRLLNNNLYILKSISFLLEEADLNSSTTLELLTEAEMLEVDLRQQHSSEILKVLTMVYIGKSYIFLRSQRIEEGLQEYEKAKQCCHMIEDEDKDDLLQIRLELLHLMYLQLPCIFEVQGHDVDFLSKLANILTQITNHINLKVDCFPFALSICLRVYNLLVTQYMWMYLPREVRCYGRDKVTFSQQYFLLLQAASFLICLAEADLQSLRLDDCQVKLNGLLDMLGLDNRQNYNISKVDEPIIKVTEVEDLTENFKEVMLDYPVKSYKWQSSLSSPILRQTSLKMPSFIRHDNNCTCFCCLNVEYKILVLETINLEAQLHVYQKNLSAAKHAFELGLYLYDNMSNDAFKTKINNYFSYFVPDLKDMLSTAFCKLIHNYVNFLLTEDDINSAELHNEMILKKVSSQKYLETFLYSEILFQQYAIKFKNIYNKSNSAEPNLQIKNEVNGFMGAEKTPENRRTNIILKCSLSPRPNSPPRRRLLKVKCDFSEYSPEKDHQVTLNSARKQKPITESYKIYDEESVDAKIDHMNRVSSAQKPVLQNIQMSTRNQECSIRVSDVIPSSPNAYTPNAMKVSLELESRTKLLTRKLKQSRMNKNENLGECQSLEDANSAGPSKENVCKNLMNEYEREKDKKRCRKKKTTKQGSSTLNTAFRSTRSRTANK